MTFNWDTLQFEHFWPLRVSNLVLSFTEYKCSTTNLNKNGEIVSPSYCPLLAWKIGNP